MVGNFFSVSQLELGSGMSAQVSKTQCCDRFYVTITEYPRLEYLLKIDLSQQHGSTGKGLLMLNLSSISGTYMVDGGED